MHTHTHIYISCICIYSSSLWSSLTGVNIEMNPCRVRTDDTMLFYGLASREAITLPLNLTDIRYLHGYIVLTVMVINLAIRTH